jgi:hypothetical protein
VYQLRLLAPEAVAVLDGAAVETSIDLTHDGSPLTAEPSASKAPAP